MPHFKCVPCKTRIHGPADFADEAVGGLCPGCGALLEPVGELSEIVGFRAIRPREGTAGPGAGGTPEQVAGRIGALVALRTAVRAQALHDYEVAQAVAVSRPEGG